MFTTGHQANVGTLGTILGPSDTVVADSGDHASILDGCLLSRAKLRPFRHNRMDLLERRLEAAAGDGGGVLVVVDGVFSMEGDIAPLNEITELCGRFGARLMVDEAHALGVLGARGAGTCELLGVEDRADLRMATFSKSLASCGGVIAGPADVIEFLRVQSRAVHVHRVRGPRGARSGARRGPDLPVLGGAGPVRQGARQCPLPPPRPERARAARGRAHNVGDGMEVVTTVVPVVVGDDWKAALLWKALYDAGLYVNVALHPAVPPAGALLRTSVMATHDRAALDRAVEIFAEVKRAFEAEHGPLPASDRVSAEHPLACPLTHKQRGGEKTRSKRMPTEM